MFNKLFKLIEPISKWLNVPKHLKDKFAHFLYSFIANGALFSLLYFVSYAGLKWSLVISFILVNLAGLVKEKFDSLDPLNKFSCQDILANITGSGLFLLIIFLLT